MGVILALGLWSQVGVAQVRVGRLIIRPGQTYTLENSDILVADTLIMMDSSRLVLNKLKQENYIRAQYATFGKGVVIDGRGIDGKKGRKGVMGLTPSGPCRDGSPGRPGGRGLDGTPGVNLFLYLDQVTMKGSLRIDLTGGKGGDGGDGGIGGSGSPGTVHCTGGNGSNGGDAGKGGNGADGGTLMFNSKRTPKFDEWVQIKKIVVANGGGYAGQPGKAGYHGSAGLGPSRKNGKDGIPGMDSTRGNSGINGSVRVE